MMSFGPLTLSVALLFIFASSTTERTSALATSDFIPYLVKSVDLFYHDLKLLLLLRQVVVFVALLIILSLFIHYLSNIDSIEKGT